MQKKSGKMRNKKNTVTRLGSETRPKITGFLSAAKWKQIIVFSVFS